MDGKGDIPVTIPPVEVEGTDRFHFFVNSDGDSLKVNTRGKRLRLTVRIGQTEFITRIPQKNWFLKIDEDDRKGIPDEKDL